MSVSRAPHPPRRSAHRRWLRRHWPQLRWLVLALFWLSPIVLGLIGFQAYFDARGETHSLSTLTYLTLQLFPLQLQLPGDDLPFELDLARFLAPLVTVGTPLLALLAIFGDRASIARLRFARDHVVICGLGRSGWPLAQGFLDRGERVVVIEQDAENDRVEQCRDAGITVLLGDATRPDVLRRAGVPRARYLLSVCGQDGVNAEIAVHAHELVAGRRAGALTCLVQVIDPLLCGLMREREIGVDEDGRFRLEFFNIFDSGARTLLNEHSELGELHLAHGPAPRLLVVGLGRLGQSLVVHAARRWWPVYAATGARLRIDALDVRAKAAIESLRVRYPRLDRCCELVGHNLDLRSAEFQRGAFLFDEHGRCELSTIFVCVDNDSLGLSSALTLLGRLREHNIPIVVRMNHDAGLRMLLEGGSDGRGAQPFDRLHPFSLLERTCTPALLIGGTHELLARLIHESYLEHHLQLGETPADNPSLVEWEELPEILKESNRHAAAAIGRKLRAIGCSVVPLADWDAQLFELAPEEVELLARQEHERFVDERRRAGWRDGPRKDHHRRLHPRLVPWDDLREDVREFSRHTVRHLPVLLSRAGLEIYRPGRGAPAAPPSAQGTMVPATSP